MARIKTALTPKKRRDEIVNLSSTVGLVSVPELADRFGVTASTIRRDLQILEEQGLIARTYGGAIHLPSIDEQSLHQRLSETAEVKLAIACRALQQITDNEHVYLDGGSTVGALAGLMPGRVRAKVMAVGLNALTVLVEKDGIEVSSPGGTIRATGQTFVGPIAESVVSRQTFDCCFLSADGVSAELGLCEAESRQTYLKELVAQRSSRVYVLADASKIDRQAFHNWAVLPDGWTLVTDESLAAEQIREFEARGINVLVA